MSPRRPSPAQKSVSPYKWVRQDFESPSVDVETCKRRLLFKLDDLARGVRGAYSKNQTMATSSSSPSMAPRDNSPRATPTSSNGRVPSMRHVHSASAVSSDALGVRDSPDSSGGENDPASNSPELSAAPKSRIDTSTFTRPKHGAGKRGAILQYNSELYKRQSSPGPRDTPSPHERGMSPCAVPHAEPQQNGNQEENGNEDDSSAPMWHRLADVEDVQVMARMQEESLRQSFSSPATRRALPRGLAKSTASGLSSLLHDNAEVSSSSTHSSNRSSPGRFDSDMGYAALRRSSNSLASGSSHSNSPPDSPYGSQMLDRRPQFSDPSHRSMPNLAGRLQRAPPQSHTNESQAGHNTRLQPRRSPATGSGLKAPSGASRALSPRRISRMASPGRTLSPMRGSNLVVPSQSSMLPAPKTYGMPRNNSASKLPSPKRSLGTGLRKPSSTATLGDSWKDGCY
ncbi:hypothetical protein NP493_433g02005 [Ridgeia piscesae]|uniref:Uncharacterized protein n=1 Tax=Ridgeia piscesae TaxID=27915 RepID=A0AAD9L095_RIDPI|nr:hypothetical protein NP493_433g02005 [Ridgeia piscesae]